MNIHSKDAKFAERRCVQTNGCISLKNESIRPEFSTKGLAETKDRVSPQRGDAG